VNPPKGIHPLAWLWFEEKLDQEEDERASNMTDAEIRAEMLAEGIDPDAGPPMEELLARAEREAAKRALERARREAPPGGGPYVPGSRLTWN
jgi:regulator of protease activity HflC (stomatin/prohibitin superfamily)